ncbi:MAG: hypothetical protein LBJ61_03180 [Deltaproteobacteria bacterium]|jgi:hypothetical protein|nr:hypothetical protein [Deltaproteobacteria bacterium]
MKYLVLIAGAFILFASGPFDQGLFAQGFSASDFLPPAQAGSNAEADKLLKVQEPTAVATETGPITDKEAFKAANPQDAINAYIAQGAKSGFTELIFPSGFGFAATGSGIYRQFDNPTATRINQRNAYNKAFVEAKKNLTEGLYGLSNNGKTIIGDYMANIDTQSRTLTNSLDLSSESIEQKVEGLIRGFVVYHVRDDFENSTVYVTIVTTPKTRGHFERPDSSTIIAENSIDGLNEAITQIKNGLVSPVGGMTVFVPSTGEMAYVGFGSAVIRFDNDKALQAKHNLNAEKLARARATDSLCGFIVGDTIGASYKTDNQISDMVKDFDAINSGDPLLSLKSDSPNYKALSERKQAFLSEESSSSIIASLRQGTLPPGTKTESWIDKTSAFAYALSVYLPSASERASKARENMLDGQIIGTPKQNRPAPKQPPATAGPSGTVQDYEVL